ncbi:MAG TPA: hypothetical protein ENJ18_11940 [Nannocystis exedens]|nr:hypothetical protein [Nannocystis exedens]
MESLVFDIFPARGLDQSLLFPVLAGMLTLFLFTEAFGWVFVGLVVPGYMASVAIVQPGSWLAMMLEAIVTYGLVRLLSSYLSRSGAWSVFFGRERFYVIVLTSVLVRQHSQLWALPAAARWLSNSFGPGLELESGFMSIGLVLVPLTANMFWKLSLRRGLLQILVPTAITYLLLRGLVLPYTNFSLSSMELTYEGLALSFISSPKAYIIMLVAALLASRFNLKFGWDYNGILVPTLLALAWMTPSKIVTTILEALLLVMLTGLLVRAPLVRDLNLEGPRKIALVFTIGFTVKFFIGAALGDTLPTLQATDLFGFGYLVPSLLAVKIIQVKSARRILIPAVVTSLLSFVLGNVVGVALDVFLPRPEPELVGGSEFPNEPREQTLTRSGLGVGMLARARARPPTFAADGSISRREQRRSLEFWKLVGEVARDRGPGDLEPLRQRTLEGGIDVHVVTDGGLHAKEVPTDHRAIVLYELEARLSAQRGAPTVMIVPQARGPLLAIPRPSSEPTSVRAALPICAAINCSAIIYAGIEHQRADRQQRSEFGAALRGLCQGLSCDTIMSLHTRLEENNGQDRGASLAIRGALPSEIDISRLSPSGVAIQWRASNGAYGGWLNDDHQLALILPATPIAAPTETRPSIPASLQVEFASASTWLDLHRNERGPWIRNTPSQTELRLLELLTQEIVERASDATPGKLQWLDDLSQESDVLGLSLHLIDGCAGGQTRCIAINGDQPSFDWGQVLIRLGRAAPIAVEVPIPRREPGTWRFATEVWRTSSARAVLFGSWAKRSESGLRARPSETHSPFHAFHRGLERSLANEFQPLILQLRGLAARRSSRHEITVAAARNRLPPRLLRMTGEQGELSWLGPSMSVGFQGREHAGLASSSGAQLRQVQNAQTADFAALWVSYELRSRYFDMPAESEQQRGEWTDRPLLLQEPELWLTKPRLGAAEGNASSVQRDLWKRLLELAELYIENRDMHSRQALLTASAESLGANQELTPKFVIETAIAWSDTLSAPYVALRIRGAEVEQRAVLLFTRSESCPSLDIVQKTDTNREIAAAFAHRCQRISLRGTPPQDLEEMPRD